MFLPVIRDIPIVRLICTAVMPETRDILSPRTQGATAAEKRGDIWADADEAYLLVDG